jgi:anti-sigma factor RsiW
MSEKTPMTEQDLELLETYLDGEMSVEESAELRDRVSGSPELAGALEMLRAERATRAQAWPSFEPSLLEIDRLADRLERTIGQAPAHPVWDRVLSIGRIVTAAAACLVMGIAIGRMNGAGALPGGLGSATAGATSSQQAVDVVLTDDTGRVFVQRFDSMQAARQFIDDIKRAREQQLRDQGVTPPHAPEQF